MQHEILEVHVLVFVCCIICEEVIVCCEKQKFRERKKINYVQVQIREKEIKKTTEVLLCQVGLAMSVYIVMFSLVIYATLQYDISYII